MGLFCCHNHIDDFCIGLRHGVISQCIDACPYMWRFCLQQGEIAASTGKEKEMQHPIRVCKAGFADTLPVACAEPGFLFQFPNSGLLGLLTGFDFTAGKRPKTATMLMFAPF